MVEVSKKHTRTMGQIYSKLVVKIQDTRMTSGNSIVNFKHIAHFILLLILLNSNKCWLGPRNSGFRQ